MGWTATAVRPRRSSLALVLWIIGSAPAVAAPVTPPAEEIVVTASRKKCGYRVADRDISDREIDARARIWALGTPVRVVLPRGADRKCMIEVGMRLARQGVRLMEFVDGAPVR